MPPLLYRVAASLAPARLGAHALPDPSATMAAISYGAHGGPEVLRFSERHPRPLPSAKQVLVRIHAASLNPVDLKLRSHSIPGMFCPLPKIPGSDLAGVVDSAPEKSRFRPGARVFSMIPLLGTPWGTHAEYVAVEDRFLAPAPTGLAARAAASLPLVALTVLQGLLPFERAHRRGTAGKRVLVHAASGGVGSFAVQYCRHVLGMEVAATCSARQRDRVRALGAGLVIDYASQAFEDYVHDYDLVIDPWGYEDRGFRSDVLRRGGYYVRVASSPLGSHHPGWTIPEAAPGRLLAGFTKQALRNLAARLGLGNAFYKLVFVHPDGRMLERVARLVDAGLVQPCVDRVYSLADAAAAHRYLESGLARGKVILEAR